MISLKIITVLVSGGLFWWGGYSNHNMRRFVMPTLLSAVCVFLIHSWWELLMLCSMGCLVLGYGTKSPFYHCFGDGWGRGVWGFLVGLCLSTPLFLSGHLFWYYYIGYLALSFTLENALKKLPQWIGDPIIGCAFGSIVFLIH